MTMSSENNTVAVGEILVSQWGYEQTNVCFYKVLKAGKSMITIQRLNTVYVNGSDMTRSVQAGTELKGEPMTRKWSRHGNVAVNESERAYKASRTVYSETC